MNEKRQHQVFTPLLVGPLSGLLAGICLGEWNVLLERLKGNSIFDFSDLAGIAIWHGLLWLVIGLAAGLVWTIWLAVRRRPQQTNCLAWLIIFCYFAAWLLGQGFINIYIFAGILNRSAIALNAIIFILAVAGLVLLGQKFKKKAPSFNLFWKSYLAIHLAVLLAGLVALVTPANIRQHRLGNEEQALIPVSGQSAKNVVLVVWDAVRADHLSCYGYPRQTSPFLDQLASRGILFEQAIAASSHTVESIPSLLSSTLPTSHQMNDITSYLPSSLIIIPQVFRALGYNTAAFSFNPYFSPAYGYNKGLDRFFAPDEFSVKAYKTIFGHILDRSRRLPVVGQGLKPVYLLSQKLATLSFGETELASTDPEAMTTRVVSWIKNHAHKPFFLLVHLEGGHAPYLAPAAFVKKFWPEENLPESQSWPTTFPPSLGLFLPFREGPEIAEAERQKMIALYDAKIAYHDYWLGQLLEFLQTENKLNDTLLLVTADHGEEFFDHRGWGHGHSLYQELIHVPLVMCGESWLPAGLKISTTVSLLDLFPTLFYLLGLNEVISLAYPLEGEDLSQALGERREPEKKQPTCSELTQGSQRAWSLVSYPWKIIHSVFSSEEVTELYNLANDPQEKNDLSATYPEETMKLLTSLHKIINLAGQKVFKSQRRWISPAEKERLRSLGYID
ncbi:MAG TPA: sulfatase-like hydrolase/transferase [Candidatus Saccharicenans sp.]|nr:sulfatase-like hydrolase/transferase [Candidatus Saccharicenans sp.]HQM74411.1 sulfatase-like hydrolase/transferase [Candidatus Saccharicenans sp.]